MPLHNPNAVRTQTAFRGDRLKQARKIRGLTQDELSERISVQRTTITMLENGMQEGTSPTIAALAGELNVSADWLLDLVDSPDGHAGTLDRYDLGYQTALDALSQHIEQIRKEAQS